jgi:phosphoribosyl 1,2-cyclic phosphate phosphodiesterase
VIFVDSGSDELLYIRDAKPHLAQFLTHFHADHAYGLLRLRHTMARVPLYHPSDERGFGDLLQRPHGFDMRENVPFEPIKAGPLYFTPLPLTHSRPTHGYLIESEHKRIAYLTDLSAVPEESMRYMRAHRIDAVFIDAAYDSDFDEGKHLSFVRACEIIDEIGAREGYLIHQSHYSLSYVMRHTIQPKYPYISEGFEYEL